MWRVEVPLAARYASVAGQDLFHVGVGNAARPRDESRVAGHRLQSDQGLQVVAVQLGIAGRQLAETGSHRSAVHRVRHHVGHAIEPGRAAEILGYREQSVLGIFTRSEQTRRTEYAGAHFQVGGNRLLNGGVANLVSQHLEQPALVQVGSGQLRGQDEIGIQVGARVVRRVQAGDGSVRQAHRTGADQIGQQQSPRVGVCQPGFQQPIHRCCSRIELPAVGACLLERASASVLQVTQLRARRLSKRLEAGSDMTL